MEFGRGSMAGRCEIQTVKLLGGVIVCRDITEIKKEEFFRFDQSRVLEMIAANAALPEVLTELVLLMEAQADGLLCSILVLTRDGLRVRHGAAPSLPKAYVEAVNDAPIGPRHGSCGTAMYLKKPVVVTDVLTDPLWADYRRLAEICGLRACWSTPILSPNGEVLGSFAMYRQENAGPNAEELRLTQIATHIAGIAIERQRAQEMLREREARINLAAESADLAFWVIYPEGNTAWMSDKGRKMYGFDSELAANTRLDLRTCPSGGTGCGSRRFRPRMCHARDLRIRTPPRSALRQDALGHRSWTLPGRTNTEISSS